MRLIADIPIRRPEMETWFRIFKFETKRYYKSLRPTPFDEDQWVKIFLKIFFLYSSLPYGKLDLQLRRWVYSNASRQLYLITVLDQFLIPPFWFSDGKHSSFNWISFVVFGLFICNYGNQLIILIAYASYKVHHYFLTFLNAKITQLWSPILWLAIAYL